MTYDQIAAETGLSRTGVFDICKRHVELGAQALHDNPGGRKKGEGRTLTRRQESLLKGLLVAHTPDELTLPEALWTRRAVGRLVEDRLGMHLAVRTLDSYLARWGFRTPRAARTSGSRVCAAVSQWLIDVYPGVAAKSKLEGGEIHWGAWQALTADDTRVPVIANPSSVPSLRSTAGRRPLSMISSVTNLGQQRWRTFAGALDAAILIDFLRRLIKGKRRKVFLIMSDMRVRHELPVAQWLAEHEDDIQTFDLPDDGSSRLA